MELSYAIARYEQALELLPVRWQQAARRLPDWRKAQAEEFRLRTGRPMTVLTCEGEILVSDELPRALVTQSDLEQLCDMVTGYSRYAVSETLSKGYLIGRGGFRVGVCGTAVLRDGANTNLRDISSVAVRISRQVRGLAEPLLRELWEPEGFPSTLLLAPPGVGKTTLLRDMICALSDGDEQRPACRVGIVDERGELAAMYRGVPQLEVGPTPTCWTGVPKRWASPCCCGLPTHRSSRWMKSPQRRTYGPCCPPHTAAWRCWPPSMPRTGRSWRGSRCLPDCWRCGYSKG